VVKRLSPLPIEAVVRGYLIGSGWRDYQKTGATSGHKLPVGLLQAAQLPAPIFAPASKAEAGDHDENISFDDVSRLIGTDLANQVRETSLAIYGRAASFALERGIIIADTKFEFGLDESGRLHLIDEVLTPDSSRFWPVAGYRTGISPPSFDKQFVRDYLDTLDWGKTAPGPKLPGDVLARTAEKYREALDLLTA
jgi:phosphoribosylaminoimidazole-succinocarboxamide synthase